MFSLSHRVFSCNSLLFSFKKKRRGNIFRNKHQNESDVCEITRMFGRSANFSGLFCVCVLFSILVILYINFTYHS